MENTDIVQFEDYFQLTHATTVHIDIGDKLSSLPEQDLFEQQIPEVFKIASEMKGVEQNMLRPLRQLGDVVEPLANYLKAQSRKIDLMMNYVLKQQTQAEHTIETVSYGGGGFCFESASEFPIENFLVCKLFFNDDAAAVYCLGQIIEVTETDNQHQQTNLYKVRFGRIREDDREIVVRATLHQQSKQLLKNKQS